MSRANLFAMTLRGRVHIPRSINPARPTSRPSSPQFGFGGSMGGGAHWQSGESGARRQPQPANDTSRQEHDVPCLWGLVTVASSGTWNVKSRPSSLSEAPSRSRTAHPPLAARSPERFPGVPASLRSEGHIERTYSCRGWVAAGWLHHAWPVTAVIEDVRDCSILFAARARAAENRWSESSHEDTVPRCRVLREEAYLHQDAKKNPPGAVLLGSVAMAVLDRPAKIARERRPIRLPATERAYRALTRGQCRKCQWGKNGPYYANPSQDQVGSVAVPMVPKGAVVFCGPDQDFTHATATRAH